LGSGWNLTVRRIPAKIGSIPANYGGLPAKIGSIPANPANLPAKIGSIPANLKFASGGSVTKDMPPTVGGVGIPAKIIKHLSA